MYFDGKGAEVQAEPPISSNPRNAPGWKFDKGCVEDMGVGGDWMNMPIKQLFTEFR